ARQSLAISDRAYVMENGRIVGHGTARAIAEDPVVKKAYLGASASPPYVTPALARSC
ncbi:MAG TPA: ABC transporter ATP-binding protein, partial [Casimicrobiaceae bacterium]|nr:ABC transporter ATP-binding protein [Casimicrobiaceae bacterium]